ncbi:MAG TPA: tetratricopeptide repeat protein [Stellaceae bacterium]|nr:tetratricopeptide repeat protein [Stellaceae bacterium]
MSEPAQRAAGPTAAAPATQADPRQLFAAANERQRTGDRAGALALYCDLIERFPTYVDVYNNAAVLLKAERRIPAAIACLKRAIAYVPQSAILHSNLGNMLWLAQEFDAAMAEFRLALSLDAARPETYHNLGLLHFALGEHAEAVECYDRALAIVPMNRTIAWDRALALLASGDYERGFAAYDARFDLEDPQFGFDPKLRSVRNTPLPLWQGEDLAGRTLYVYAEQGIGDTLQFARFLPLVAAKDARIIFDSPPELLRLLHNFPGIAELRPMGSQLPAADFHLPLMSLAHRLGITLANLPARVPYIAAPASGPVLPRPPGTRATIGLVWAGRARHANDQNRSLSLEEMLGLCDLPGVQYYSLQKGERADDLAAIGARILVRDLGPAIHDFVDTARFILQLDVVVTVDTAVAHLAGALGRPAFVLIPYTPDWRWLGKREDTPWYPTLRLIRQPAPRDWKSVISSVRDRIARALK